MAKAKATPLTKRCASGNCGGDFDEPRLIPDEQEVCDFCLLWEYGLTNEHYDGCGDPHSMFPLYAEEDVVAALRQASGR